MRPPASVSRATLLVLSATLVPTLAQFQGFIGQDPGPCANPCLSSDAAQRVAQNYARLVTAYTPQLAQATLAPNTTFAASSDSLATLIHSGCPVPASADGMTFHSQSEYTSGALAHAPAHLPFEILNLWYVCQGPVVLRWRSAQTPQSVVGNVVIEVERNFAGPGPSQEEWLMKTIYSEFNSGAWAVNEGMFKGKDCAGSRRA